MRLHSSHSQLGISYSEIAKHFFLKKNLPFFFLIEVYLSDSRRLNSLSSETKSLTGTQVNLPI